MTDRIGQQLDNYLLLHQLGTGGFGEVYLAEHIHRKTQVAIKILPTLAPENLPAFLREVRSLLRLKHPNIVQILDFSVEGPHPFIVMEYAPNGTLRKRHPRGTRVSLDLVVTYVKQVASALQYAHDERLVHRDVKPENMLLGVQNQVLLSDFGIATMAHGTSSQSVEMMAGTILYMAPEQIQAHPRAASDQYSLGIVVYEWLCGTPPFQGTLTEVAAKHATLLPPPLREKVPTISPDVEQVVMTSLTKDPRKRFGSVQAFAQALANASSPLQTKEQWLAEGMAHYNAARYESALTAYDQALRLDSAYAAAYHYRGLVYVALQHYDKALADYDQALQLAPEYVPVYFDRGTAYYDLKHYDKAIADFDQVLQRDFQHAIAYRNRGHAYKELAIANYTQALACDPHDVVSGHELARLKKRQFSRRTVIAGLGGAAGLAVVSSSLTWLLFPRTLPPTHAVWYDSNYQYKKSITIDHRKVSGGSDLNNFPVLISLPGDADLRTAANGGHVQNRYGYDIIFTDSTEKVKLDHEMETYNASTGELQMWVRVPTLSATTDTVIYMYFGNSKISSSQENKPGVWDRNYKGVWHLSSGTILNANDSTSNADHGKVNGATATVGQIDGGASFNGKPNNIILKSGAIIQEQSSGTVEAWVSPSVVNSAEHSIYGEDNFYGVVLTLELDATNHFRFGIFTNGTWYPAIGTNTPLSNSWYYVVGTWDSMAHMIKIYVNGTLENTNTSWNGTFNIAGPVTQTELGYFTNDGGGAYWSGSMDEIRASNTVRSAGWIQTAYNNESSPSTFYTVSSSVSR